MEEAFRRVIRGGSCATGAVCAHVHKVAIDARDPGDEGDHIWSANQLRDAKFALVCDLRCSCSQSKPCCGQVRIGAVRCLKQRTCGC